MDGGEVSDPTQYSGSYGLVDGPRGIQLSDVWIRYEQHEFPAERPATESDLLPLFTDEALVGELVKRGVLTEETSHGCHRCDRDEPTPHDWDTYVDSRRYVSEYEYPKPVGEPVGSVGP